MDRMTPKALRLRVPLQRVRRTPLGNPHARSNMPLGPGILAHLVVKPVLLSAASKDFPLPALGEFPRRKYRQSVSQLTQCGFEDFPASPIALQTATEVSRLLEQRNV